MVLFFFFLLISSLNRALFSQLFHTGSRGRGGGVLVGKGNAFLQKCCAPALSNNFASDRRLALPCLIGKQRLLWLADVIYLSFFDRFTSWTLFWQSKTFFFSFWRLFQSPSFTLMNVNKKSEMRYLLLCKGRRYNNLFCSNKSLCEGPRSSRVQFGRLIKLYVRPTLLFLGSNER